MKCPKCKRGLLVQAGSYDKYFPDRPDWPIEHGTLWRCRRCEKLTQTITHTTEKTDAKTDDARGLDPAT